ncbi:HNH endonuclease signature motif containing protein [Cellulomonas sp. URHD0024]|uniref:HNH endonuclease signature motif containing protein n=1 Tax=Cellulomonas sp. URHD0024 TaxID=1302620 RepID=UPI0006846E66|nr:HNH endonuclease signature motif containing protein [Cellulomonas sp. URHD0024]
MADWSEPWRDSAFPSFPAACGSVAELSALLEAVDPADVSDGDLVNGVAGWQQVLCAVQAAQAIWLAELGARASMPDEWVPDQIASELAVTRRSAQDLFLRACLAAARPALRDAWAAGAVDARKVDVILKEIAYLNADAPLVEPVVLADAVAHAPRLTAPQLAQHVRKQVLLADAGAAERRRVTTVQDRCVTLTPSVDGVAWINALLPAQDAVAVFTAVDALARTARVRGDQRTADQRRADAFTEVFVGMLQRQATPDGSPLPRRHGQAVTVNVTVAASTLLGLDERPGWLDSYGPITAPLARELAQDGTWRRLLTDPATGLVCEGGTVTYRPGIDVTRTVLARDVTCTFPGCRQPAARCDLDHRVPFDPGRSSHDQTCEANLHALCRHHHRAKTARRWNVTYDSTSGISTWTSWLGFTYRRDPYRMVGIPEVTDHALDSPRAAEIPPPGRPDASSPTPEHPSSTTPERPPPSDPPPAGPLSRGRLSGGATSDGATSGGATSDGATSGGATSGGAMSDGATSGGATSGGAMSDGATSGGAMSDGATSDGATSGGATSGGAMSDGATSGGAMSDGATSEGSAFDALPPSVEAWGQFDEPPPF